MKTSERRNSVVPLLLPLALLTAASLYAGTSFPFHEKVLDTEGREVTLENLEGKKGIIVVYTSSMPDCKERIERFVRLSERFVQGEVVFTALDITPRGREDFLKNLPENLGKVTFRKDLRDDLGRKLGVKLIPTTFFISPEGAIVEKYESLHAWDSEDFTEKTKKFISDGG